MAVNGDTTISGVASPPRAGTVAVLTLGCKLNLAESDAIAGELAARGYRVIDRPAVADAYVINSCSVTHVADRKSRHLVRMARRLAPEATVLLTGCYPESAGHATALATGADLVVPSRDKAAVVEQLLQHLPAGAPPPAVAPAAVGGHTRAFIKVQEGCNDVCAFCIVPRTRGRERTVPVDDVVAQVAARERAGAQEVVLTGTQLGVYGRDENPADYGPARVIQAVLAETSVPRLRFSSLQPQDLSPALLALWEDPRLCRHFHLALQSGSDSVLKRMRRRYSLAEYRAALALIREYVPGAAITTDVIVGFPGETDAEATESLAFCQQAGFAQLHVFPYSRRQGTTAHLLKDHVPDDVKRARMAAMLDAARGAAAAWRAGTLGQTLPVLWEEAAPADTPGQSPRWTGLTDTYVRVFTHAAADLTNRILPVTIERLDDDGVWGALDRPPAPSTTIPLRVVARS